MRIHPGMKMLAAVVVLFLAVGVSDSMILTKCGLKQQLQTNLTLPPNMTDMLAQIVCHVQMASNFNTSAIKAILLPQKTEEIKGPGKGRTTKGPVKKNVTRPPIKKSGEDKSDEDKGGKGKSELWILYGLFQLSGNVVCSSPQSHSLNLCGLTCDKLLDDNITDDVACVQTIISKMTAVIPDPEIAERIHKMISLIYQPECAGVKASTYFFDCL